MAKLSNDKKNINFYYYNRFKVKSKDLSLVNYKKQAYGQTIFRVLLFKRTMQWTLVKYIN